MSKKIKYLLLIILTCCSFVSNAQKKRIFLFEEYTNGSVLLKNGSKVSVLLNYDASNRKMMFKQDNMELILVNGDQIDTVYIDNRKFVPIGDSFREVVSLENGLVFIDWSLKNAYRGYKGAYGQLSQAKVEVINTAELTHDLYENQYAEVYELKNANAYEFYHKGRFVRCKKMKDVLKVFPGQKDSIQLYIKKERINFSNVADALKLIDYCLGFKL